MKTEKELNAAILKITLKIAETFPELSKFIAETPVQKVECVEIGVNLNNLNDYCESLETLFRDYKKKETEQLGFSARNQFITNSSSINYEKMTKSKKLGIWMDHCSAHLMEFSTDPVETKTIQSVFRNQEKKHFFSRGEKGMHNKEQEEQAEYYKKLENIIQNYEEVLLFGATEAKVELFNLLKADCHFTGIKIEMDTTDKMTDNQQHAFVKHHFSKN